MQAVSADHGPELSDAVARIGPLGGYGGGRYGNEVTPIWGGPESYRALFDLLDSAEHHIHIEMYIVGRRTWPSSWAAVLAAKAQQGIQVRILFTASGFVMSGAPSGGGLVSSWSEARSYWMNDRYTRKRIVDAMRERERGRGHRLIAHRQSLAAQHVQGEGRAHNATNTLLGVVHSRCRMNGSRSNRRSTTSSGAACLMSITAR